MVSCAKYIVEPTLQAGEKLTSLNLQKIMKGSKTVYLLPDMKYGDKGFILQDGATSMRLLRNNCHSTRLGKRRGSSS